MAWSKPSIRVLNFRTWSKAGFIVIGDTSEFYRMITTNLDKRYMVRFGRLGTLENHSEVANRGWRTGDELMRYNWLHDAYMYKPLEIENA
jgi:hypothetical protein